MFIKSSAKRHPFVAFILSIGSLVLIHGIVIWGHKSVNYSQPTNHFLYAIDQGLENVEYQWAKWFGVTSELEYHLYHVRERSEELEYVLRSQATDYLPMLISEIQRELDLSQQAFVRLISQESNSPLTIKTVAVELDTEIEKSRKKIRVAIEELDINNESLEQLLAHFRSIHSSMIETLAALSLEIEDDSVQQTGIIYIPVQAQITSDQSSSEPLEQNSTSSESCVPEGGICRDQSNCCKLDNGFDGVQLSCIFDPDRSGQRAMRCLR